jgi:uncharacterized protein (TIGR02300 family)
VAKPELGTKRICPETGRKFYDLNKDPIVSPYTGKTYPLSYFEDTKSEVIEEKAEEVGRKPEAETEDEDEDTGAAEVVSLEDAEEEEDTSKDDKLPDLGDNTDDEIEIDDDDEDDTFLADDDDDDEDDVAGIIDVSGDDDES